MLDKKPLVEPLLSMWISLVSRAASASVTFKPGYDQLLELDTTDGEYDNPLYFRLLPMQCVACLLFITT